MISSVALHVVLLLAASTFVIPFIWTLSTALKSPDQVYSWPIKWIPNPVVWGNFKEAWTALPFTLYLWNTLVITFTCVVGEVITACLAGYAFARIRFVARETIFLVMLGTMMIPGHVRMIPTFVLFKSLGWLDTFWPFIIPAFLGSKPFYIFLLRQFFRTIPMELDDAARIDGCSSLQIFLRILLPLSKPAVATVLIFSFMFRWNDFWGPLIYLNSKEKYTMALGLSLFRGEFATEYHLMMAISLAMLAPCLILFFSAQKYFVKGVVLSGLKG
jgi:ABC-type glycerol-3-phosphate transport system permease component